MNLITILRKLARKDDLVIIPRREYEALLALKKVKEFEPTLAHKRALARAEKNFRNGKTLSYSEFRQKLDLRD